MLEDHKLITCCGGPLDAVAASSSTSVPNAWTQTYQGNNNATGKVAHTSIESDCRTLVSAEVMVQPGQVVDTMEAGVWRLAVPADVGGEFESERSINSTLGSGLSSPLIDMADQRPPQTAKASKGFCNRLKKVFGRGSQSRSPSHSNSSPAVAPPAVVASPPTVAAPAAVALPPADLPSTVSTMTVDLEEAAKLRATYTHFRILVIGRANAGKTTLLKRVCNTVEDPVYSEVRYQLRLIPRSYRPFTGRLTRPRRCELGDLCAFLWSDRWLWRRSEGSIMYMMSSPSRATHNSSSTTLLVSRQGASKNFRTCSLSYRRKQKRIT